MRFDPLIPVPVVVAGAVVMVAFVVARVIRAGIGLGVARGALIAIAGLAIVADPAVTGGASDARRISADVVFVVDSTSSMGAVDYDGGSQRLEGVRADILEIAERFRGANFSVVRFDSQARLELPWTTDFAALETAVSVIRQERAVYSQGSTLELPLSVLDALVPRPGSIRAVTGQGESYVVVFYFSDGEVRATPPGNQPQVDSQTAVILAENDGTESVMSSFAELAPDVDGGAVLGYGTPEGAPMIEFHGTDELFVNTSPYVLDYATGETAISRYDEGNLVDIADDLGVPYLHRTEPGGLGALATGLADDAPVVSDGARETLDRLYWIPALLLLALVMWQAVVTASEARSTQRLLAGRSVGVAVSEPAPTTRPAASRRPTNESAA